MSDKIICFGDSNTYGYDIRSFLGGRFPKESRWTGILDKSSDFEVINYGENGREIPSSQEELKRFDRILKLEAPFDLLIVMLGTNDLLNIFHLPSFLINFVLLRLYILSLVHSNFLIFLLQLLLIKLWHLFLDM